MDYPMSSNLLVKSRKGSSSCKKVEMTLQYRERVISTERIASLWKTISADKEFKL